ncbi:MAG: hypothetical protein ACE15F_20345 [bacterium]
MPPSLSTKSFIQLTAGCAVLTCFAGLLATAYPAFWGEAGLSGYRLFLHAGIAPVFAAGVTFLALALAPRHTKHRSGSFLLNASFWLILIAAVPLILSSALAMFPILGMRDQRILLLTHRYCAAVLSVFVVLYVFLLIIHRPGKTA